MDTKALRQKILDLAIRGKLVPQDPNDEPASVLLERIRAEKQQMVKDGKLKAKDIKNDTIIYKGDDNLHYEKFPDGSVKCIEDEIPFELPQGWSWERLGNISNIARGGSPRPIESYITDDSNGINWIKIGDTEKDGKYIFKTKEKIKPEGLSKSRYVEAGDFLLTNSMSFGRPYILKTNGCIHDGWLVIGNIRTVFNADFLYFALSSNFMYQTLSLLAAGSTVKNLKSDTVKSVLFPIPPIQEQERIATKLDELISFVNNIESDKTSLQDLIKQTKSKILDLAIRGKLVPQDPNDEPASVLLERIRAEKEELIKQGKIKRDKKESVIFKGEDNSYYETIGNKTTNIDDEIPFDLPEGWEWCRLGYITSLVTDYVANGSFATLKENVRTYKEKNYALFIRTVDFANNFEKDLSYIDKESYDFLNKSQLFGGELMLSNIGASIGKVFKIPNFNYPMSLAPNSIILKFYFEITSDFFEYVFKSFVGQNYLMVLTAGTAMPKFNKTELKQMIVPLPPLPEQTRIVKAIETAFAQLDEIANSIA